MIKLLKYLADTLEKEDLYNLAMFLSDNPDVIDQETLLHIINDVNVFEVTSLPPEINAKLDEIQEHFREMDQHKELHKILKDNIDNNVPFGDMVHPDSTPQDDIQVIINGHRYKLS